MVSIKMEGTFVASDYFTGFNVQMHQHPSGTFVFNGDIGKGSFLGLRLHPLSKFQSKIALKIGNMV
jgi:hypothetical protein